MVAFLFSSSISSLVFGLGGGNGVVLSSPASNVRPHFKQVTLTLPLPINPASSPMPPVSKAPVTALPAPNPFLLAVNWELPQWGHFHSLIFFS